MLDSSTKPCVSICDGMRFRIHFVSFSCGISMLIRLLRDEAFDNELLVGVEDCFFFLLGVEEDFDVLDCIAATLTLGVVSFCV